MAISSGKSDVDYNDPLIDIDLGKLGLKDLAIDSAAVSGQPLVASSYTIDTCAWPARQQVVTEQVKLSMNQLYGRYPRDRDIMVWEAKDKAVEYILNYVRKFVKVDVKEDWEDNSMTITARFDPQDMP